MGGCSVGEGEKSFTDALSQECFNLNFPSIYVYI